MYVFGVLYALQPPIETPPNRPTSQTCCWGFHRGWGSFICSYQGGPRSECFLFWTNSQIALASWVPPEVCKNAKNVHPSSRRALLVRASQDSILPLSLGGFWGFPRVPGGSWGFLGVDLGPIRARFGADLGLIWGRFGADLGPTRSHGASGRGARGV